jgi:Arc/MetJ family transcription regulator
VSGERKGQRERVDAMVRQMVKNGARADYARQKAVDAAKKNDRKS